MVIDYLKTVIYSGVSISLVNGLLLGVSELFEINIAVRMADEERERIVNWFQIIPESFLMPIIAVIIIATLKKYFINHYLIIFISISVIVTAIWSIGPIQQGVDLYSKIVLTATHLVIMIIPIIVAKRIIAKQRPPASSTRE